MPIETPSPEGTDPLGLRAPAPIDADAGIGERRSAGVPRGPRAICPLDLSQRGPTPQAAPDRLDFTSQLAHAIHRHQLQSYLMAVAGHDLKQPLQVILMVLDNLAAKLTPTDRAFADIAISEIRHLSRGLDDLALAAQLEPVALVLPALAPLNAQALLDEIAGSWRLHAQVKGLSVAVRANVKTVFSNRDLVCAVLRNLVGNAIKYTDSGGVLVSCRKRAGQIRLEVWDSGPGIDALHLKAILQPYYQADPTRGGLGLGLVIAQIAAAQLSGRIEVATRPGVGSRFTLCLPATETTG